MLGTADLERQDKRVRNVLRTCASLDTFFAATSKQKEESRHLSYITIQQKANPNKLKTERNFSGSVDTA